MADKRLLVESMQRLVSYVTLSRKNQEEIFLSLSRHDLSKIISNLKDDIQYVRQLSLHLLATLLDSNHILKLTFCTLLDVSSLTGRVILNSLEVCPSERLIDTLALLKANPVQSETKMTFWYISYQGEEPLKIEPYINFSQRIDPSKCLVGFFMTPKGTAFSIPEPNMQFARNRAKASSTYETKQPVVDSHIEPPKQAPNNYFRPQLEAHLQTSKPFVPTYMASSTMAQQAHGIHLKPNHNYNVSANLAPPINYSTVRGSHEMRPVYHPLMSSNWREMEKNYSQQETTTTSHLNQQIRSKNIGFQPSYKYEPEIHVQRNRANGVRMMHEAPPSNNYLRTERVYSAVEEKTYQGTNLRHETTHPSQEQYHSQRPF